MRPSLLILAAALALAGCGPKSQDLPTPRAAAKETSLSLGTFKGVLPCADCGGLETDLTLNRKGADWAEGDYELVETYQGKSGPMTTKGQWTTLRGSATDPDATVYQLDPDQPDSSRYFLKLGEEGIQMLDRDLKVIDSPFNMTLKKAN